MDYFQLLRLNKEPFSNSPDPTFFYPSKQHAGCLQKLEIAIRLKRGLNVIIGDVGTGKTTLCRHIVQKFADDPDVRMYLVLDPGFKNALEFLAEVARLFGLIQENESLDEWTIKERIKKFLFTEGVDNKKNIAIIIDEGQKIPYFCLEILREFLNYETNECKLLQIVIFAQQEFKAILEAHANFSDRVNICHELEPLGFFDTIKKIQFRLNKASEGRATPNIFTWPAFWAVYVATRGYPRKILHLCHLVLLGLIIQNKTRVNYFLVRSCVKRDTSGRYFQPKIFRNLILICCVCFVMSWGYKNALPDRLKFFSFHQVHQWFSIFNNKNAKTLDTPAEAGLQDNSFQMPEDDHEDKSPVILGKITCLRHETMQNLIQLFYGTYNPWYLRYVKMVNPHIHNTLSIERGQTVHFPGVPVTSPGLDHSPSNNLWWIELARFRHIHEAYSYYINYPNDAPEIMILPYWNQKAGLNFSVLYAIPFQDPTAATRFIDQFPQYISQNCRLRNKWVKGTTFFSKRMIDLSF